MHSSAFRGHAWRRCPGARATTNRRSRCRAWCACTARSNASPSSRRLVRPGNCMVCFAHHRAPSAPRQVIKQTKIYASSRGGRLSVFWGDQIFVPAKSVRQLPRAHRTQHHTTRSPCGYQAKYAATAQVDILARLGDWPTKAEWEARGLEVRVRCREGV